MPRRQKDTPRFRAFGAPNIRFIVPPLLIRLVLESEDPSQLARDDLDGRQDPKFVLWVEQASVTQRVVSYPTVLTFMCSIAALSYVAESRWGSLSSSTSSKYAGEKGHAVWNVADDGTIRATWSDGVGEA